MFTYGGLCLLLHRIINGILLGRVVMLPTLVSKGHINEQTTGKLCMFDFRVNCSFNIVSALQCWGKKVFIDLVQPFSRGIHFC